MGKKVISAGHICLDITPAFLEGTQGKISEVLKPGKLIEVGDAIVSTGGSVANTGLGMKILGADVMLMGKVGNDSFGDMVCRIIAEYGADDCMIHAKDESTSYSVVLAVPGNDRVFLHNPGANHTFTYDDIDDSRLKEADHFHFGYPPLMKNMYSDGGTELKKIMRKAKECGCSTSLDMAAIDSGSEAGRADWKQILKEVLPYVDFFVPSAEELCFMLDRERFDRWQSEAGSKDITEIIDIKEDIAPLADMCLDMGAGVVMIKCGAPGLYYKTSEEKVINNISGIDSRLWAKKEGFEVSFKPERILSGTGAGDTSIAAFIVSMLEGNSPEKCVALAAAAGACCVAQYDALSGLKSLEELKRKIESGWEKIC